MASISTEKIMAIVINIEVAAASHNRPQIKRSIIFALPESGLSFKDFKVAAFMRPLIPFYASITILFSQILAGKHPHI